jgi:branched-chain amino acid transport system ATP-binding protein
VLRVEGLHAGYGQVEVLRGVDLVVPRASTVALLGANGAGKTTLLHAIAGLVPVRAGQIVLEDQPIQHMAPHARARAGICLIPQGRGVFAHLSVADNIAMFVRSGDADAAIERVFAQFPALSGRAMQQAGRLSGGEQQMLALGRAVLSDAPLWLLDELSLGLAPVVVDVIMEFVDTMRGPSRSVLVVEQYVERTLAVADYVYVMEKGEIVFVGEPAHYRADVFGSHASVAR